MSGRQAWLVVLVLLLLLLAGHAGRAAAPVFPASPAWTPKMSPRVQVTGTSTGTDATWPDVAHNNHIDQYLVVWRSGKTIYGRRVDFRGEAWGDPFQIASAPTLNLGRPRVAYDAERNRYLVIWAFGDGQVYQIYGRFVPWDGPDPALTPFAVNPDKPANTDISYALAYGHSPDEFLVVWVSKDAGTGRGVVAGRRVKAGGGFAAGSFLIASGGAEDNRGNPDVAYNEPRNQYLVVYDDYPKVNEEIYGMRLSATGTRLGGGEFVIAGWPGDEIDPAVASCPGTDQYLVAWHGFPMPGDGLWARLVSGLGAPGAVVQIEGYASWEYHRPLDLTCGATELEMEDPRYVAAWSINFERGGNAFAREIRTDGSLSERLTLSSYSGPIAVAGGATNHLVAWETDGPDNDPESDIYAAIIGNTKPKASFTVTPADGYSTVLFTFDASASHDNTDPPSQLQVRWDWDDGTRTNWSHDRIATHRFPVDPGLPLYLYSVDLEVSDGSGPSGIDTTFQVILVRNAPPAASFAIQPATGDTRTAFHFDASASTDPEDGALQVRWDWESNGAYDTGWSTDKTATHTFSTPGVHTIRAQVRDPAMVTAETTRYIHVSEEGASPHAYLPLITRGRP